MTLIKGFGTHFGAHHVSPPLMQVMYFSSVFPYVVLLCFLIRGLLLDGAMDGLKYMLYPKVLTYTVCTYRIGRFCIVYVFVAIVESDVSVT